MDCLYCKSKCVKYGEYGKNIQRYKCGKCKRTFSSKTIEKVNTEKSKRLVFHLVLAGCSTNDIASELKIDKKNIENWINRHFRGQYTFLPQKPLMAIRTLMVIYKAIEKSRFAKLNRSSRSRKRIR